MNGRMKLTWRVGVLHRSLTVTPNVHLIYLFCSCIVLVVCEKTLRKKKEKSIFFLLMTCRYTYTDICPYDKEMMNSPVYLSWTPSSWYISRCNFLLHHLPMVYSDYSHHQLLSVATCVYITYRYRSCAVVTIFRPPKTPRCSWKKIPIFIEFFWGRNPATQGFYQLPPPHMCVQSWTREYKYVHVLHTLPLQIYTNHSFCAYMYLSYIINL